MVTIQDVAKHANVSAMTVTRAIKTPECLKKETLDKVYSSIKELGYVPNFTASALRSAKSNIVSITIFDIENPFMSRLIKELEVKLKEYDKQLLTFFANEEDLDDYGIYVKSRNINSDLNIFIPTKRSEFFENLPKEELAKNIQLFRSSCENVDSFLIDDIYGAYLATDNLIKNGHEKILLIDYNQRMPIYRYKGYLQAFEENGKVADKNNIIELPEFDDSGYFDAIKEKIETLKPTAILSVTERMTIHVLNALKTLNLEVGKDVSLISYDDSKLIEYLGISAISHSFNDMVNAIAELVSRKFENKNEEVKKIKLKPFLNQRLSVVKIK